MYEAPDGTSYYLVPATYFYFSRAKITRGNETVKSLLFIFILFLFFLMSPLRLHRNALRLSVIKIVLKQHELR